MSQVKDTQQEELDAQIAQWVEAQNLGLPFKKFKMESTVRYYFRWFLILLGAIAVFCAIVAALSLKTLLSVALLGLVLFIIALLGYIYFLPSFRRYGKQHTTYFYICPRGMVGAKGKSIIYTYHWTQVQATSLNDYKGGSKYKLLLADGREFIFKGTYQPPVEGLKSAVQKALEIYHEKLQA